MVEVNIESLRGRKLKASQLFSTLTEHDRIGCVVAPALDYHCSLAMVYEIVNRIHRVSEGFQVYKELVADSTFRINDHTVDKIRDASFHNFAATDFFAAQQRKTDSNTRLRHAYVNTYTPSFAFGTLMAVLRFIVGRRQFTIKLPNIAPRAVFDLILLVAADYQNITLYKPEDDLWLLDSFYLRASEPVQGASQLEALQTQLTAHKQDLEQKNVSMLLDLGDLLEEVTYDQVCCFYEDLMDRILPHLDELVKAF